jgi:hypothetical protein
MFAVELAEKQKWTKIEKLFSHILVITGLYCFAAGIRLFIGGSSISVENKKIFVTINSEILEKICNTPISRTTFK